MVVPVMVMPLEPPVTTQVCGLRIHAGFCFILREALYSVTDNTCMLFVTCACCYRIPVTVVFVTCSCTVPAV